MFNIGEFSKITGLPVRTLRFYHEKGLLVPAAVDDQSGYRYYNERDLEVARVIVALRGMAFSLDDISGILRDCAEDDDVLVYLERQRQSLAEQLEHYRDVLRQIDHVIASQRLARKEETMSAATFEIQERDIEPMLVAGIRMKGKYSDCGKGFATLGKRVGRYMAGKPLCLYYDGEYREEDADFEPCMPIRRPVDADGISVRELPADRCVTLLHKGPYEELGRSYARILQYVKQRGYELQMPTREVFCKGPGLIFRGNPKKYLTEIQLPVKYA
jgi:DNA-binding transcriptional MerR regulator/DNA gyrase inhibitor GyrI